MTGTLTDATPTLEAYREALLSKRQQAEVRNHWLAERLNTVLPEIMARAEIDTWLVIAREYNEDPVLLTLLPEPHMTARRRTILIFHRQPDGTLEKLTLSRYDIPGFYISAWNPDEEADQYAALNRLLNERNPARIGINTSATFPFADGLSHTEHAALLDALDESLRQRLCSAERVAVGWLERRTEAEMTVYPRLAAIGHALIAASFSSRVITPGLTTTPDVVWWMRETLEAMGLRPWFQPTVELQAHGLPYDGSNGTREVIMPGDLLHCDVGFYYLGLTSDQQQHAYVLRPGETEPPIGLVAGLRGGNRLQDIVMEKLHPGKTGNDVLADSLEAAAAARLNGKVYSHPIGYHGHAAGPIIGLWDQQDGVPGRGDYPVYDDTAYSIELNVKRPVPDWGGQEVRIALEEDALLHGGALRWLHGRQEVLHLIG